MYSWLKSFKYVSALGSQAIGYETRTSGNCAVVATKQQCEAIAAAVGSAAGAAGGYAPPPANGEGSQQHLPGIGGTPVSPFGGGATSPTIGGAGITGTVPTSAFSAEANSPLNLLGKIESWGVGGSSKMKTVEISTEDFSGKQLQELLRKLPEGKYALKIEKEEDA